MENWTQIGVYVSIIALAVAIIGLIVSIIGQWWTPDEPDESEVKKKWKRKWRNRVKRFGISSIIAFICLFIFAALHDLVPVKISIDYEDTVAIVTVKDGPKWAAGVYYTIGEADEIRYKEPFSVYENTTVTICTKVWFFEIASIPETVDIFPVYEMSEDPNGIFSLKITMPRNDLNLASVLSIQENGYLNFTQINAAAGGIGGAEFIVPGINGTKTEIYYNRAEQRFEPNDVLQMGDGIPDENDVPVDQLRAPVPGTLDFDASVVPMANQATTLSDFSMGGYLTIHMPLDHDNMNSVDIVVNKGDLSGLLQRNASIYIEASYSEQTLSVSMSTGAGAGCRLDHGLLLELHGPNLLIGSYATLGDGTIIQKSVAREQEASSPAGGMGQNTTPGGQNNLPQQGYYPVPVDPPNGGLRGSFYSLIIPVDSFDSGINVRVVDTLLDKADDSTYTDVSAVDFDAVAYASGHKLLVGYDAAGLIFAPNDAITYDTMATVLFRLAGSPEISNSGDAFVEWHEEGAQWALNAGIVEPDKRGNFPGDRKLSQSQCLRTLWRFIYGKFSDDSVSNDEIQIWAVMNGIISEDAINPNGTVSRVQLARIIRNYCIADAVWRKAI